MAPVVRETCILFSCRTKASILKKKNTYVYFIWLCWVLVAAYGLKFPDQELNLGPLHWEHGVPASGPPGTSSKPVFFYWGVEGGVETRKDGKG